ncbi:DUF1499 domain-containing protein [Prochlorococcus sp. MIT 1307]|uniref:DUF1499 domain-containing protein n=1 Tax=Prochlorococcus sp. MIT 1307 TaxID=3096219 RepID=UPI002A756B7B|nr:DUF1499 domain-containing protein [Prochlorococcus sp. MIT 1307]
MLSVSSNTDLLDLSSNELPECFVITHCVRVNLEVPDLNRSFKQAKDIIEKTPRTKIIKQSDSYIHAESTTKLMHYVDDLEVKAIQEKKLLQIRSESRIGLGDMGANKKRVDLLTYSLTSNN